MQNEITEEMVEAAIEAAGKHLEIDADNGGPFIRFDSIDAAIRAALSAALAQAGEAQDTFTRKQVHAAVRKGKDDLMTAMQMVAEAQGEPVAWTQQSQLDGIANDETFNGDMWAKRDCRNVRNLLDMPDMPDDVPLYASPPVACPEPEGWRIIAEHYRAAMLFAGMKLSTVPFPVLAPGETGSKYARALSDVGDILKAARDAVIFKDDLTTVSGTVPFPDLAARPSPSGAEEARRLALEDEISDEIIEKVADALRRSDLGYSLNLTRLVDNETEYTLTIDGQPPMKFSDQDEAYGHMREHKRRVQATEVIRALVQKDKADE